jgi:hypothetical protein
MIRAVLWSILSLLHSASASLFFVKGDVVMGVFASALAIISAALSLVVAREER